jgi:hypothetical protein
MNIDRFRGCCPKTASLVPVSEDPNPCRLLPKAESTRLTSPKTLHPETELCSFVRARSVLTHLPVPPPCGEVRCMPEGSLLSNPEPKGPGPAGSLFLLYRRSPCLLVSPRRVLRLDRARRLQRSTRRSVSRKPKLPRSSLLLTTKAQTSVALNAESSIAPDPSVIR